MNEADYNYYDEAFNLQQAGNYVLLLQIGAGSFAYAVTQNNKLLAWETGHPLDELLNPGDLRDLLNAHYKQVIVGLQPNAFTLIPEAIYSDDHLQNFARFLNVQADEKVFVQQLDSENRVVYKVNQQVADAAEKFGLENTVFALKGWIKAVAGSNPEDALYGHIEGKKVTFLYYSYGKLRYLNSFEQYNADELTYYAAFVADQLKLQPKHLKICLSGEIAKYDAYTNRLAQFFNEVDTTNLPIVQLPIQVNPHHILSLSALTLCG
jgi:hypothetical protein